MAGGDFLTEQERLESSNQRFCVRCSAQSRRGRLPNHRVAVRYVSSVTEVRDLNGWVAHEFSVENYGAREWWVVIRKKSAA